MHAYYGLSKQTGDGGAGQGGAVVGSSSVGGGGSGTGSKKRFQKVEIMKIAEPCPLIDPSQVVVTQGQIFVADPVLTPIGTFSHQKNHSLLLSLSTMFPLISVFVLTLLSIIDISRLKQLVHRCTA